MNTMRRILLVVVLLGCARAERPMSTGPASCCVSSASAKPAKAAESVEQAWTKLLEAMRAGDDAAIERYTTANGRASLEKALHGEDKHVAYARWGKGWAAWETRWKSRTNDRAEAVMGPEVKEHGLSFILEPSANVWKLERWSPGE